ncbi:MAG: hypothetical protein WC856_02305 [Methylococcaceae bacterium]
MNTTTQEGQMLAHMSASEHQTNHVLHLILTIITFGTWSVVWLLVSAGNITKRNEIKESAFLPTETNIPKIILWMNAAFFALMVLVALFAPESHASLYQEEKEVTFESIRGDWQAKMWIRKIATENPTLLPNEVCSKSGLFSEDGDWIRGYQLQDCLRDAQFFAEKANNAVIDQLTREKDAADWKLHKTISDQKAQADINTGRIELLQRSDAMREERRQHPVETFFNDLGKSIINY